LRSEDDGRALKTNEHHRESLGLKFRTDSKRVTLHMTCGGSQKPYRSHQEVAARELW